MGDPSYAEVQKRIIRAAAKVYGNRVLDRAQPALSTEGALVENALVRKSIWKGGLPGKASWIDSKKASAGTNSWSSELFRVSDVISAKS